MEATENVIDNSNNDFNNVDNEWLQQIYSKLCERNNPKSSHNIKLYELYSKVLNKTKDYENKQQIIHHNLAIIEYETSDFRNKNNYIEAVDNVMSKILDINTDLNINKQYNLSKLTWEQRKLIDHQQEEIKVLKSELSLSFNKHIQFNDELLLSKQINNDVINQLQEAQLLIKSQEDKLNILKEENIMLTNRIIVEKDKYALEFNEMNHIISG